MSQRRPWARARESGLDRKTVRRYWAWWRNHRYRTLICDLERRRTIALVPDREAATAQAWLAGQPQIEVVTRGCRASRRALSR